MIGKQIRLHRLQRGYSQAYMAFCLEISQNAYSKIELDKTDISLSRIIHISKIFEISPITLLASVFDSSFEDIIEQARNMQVQADIQD